ncbi:Prokaryotic membrane lipoprotein lipid attachment site profile [Desulfitobacterium hafniense]|uniref:Prokaryotic membrane lipoprotein lipid attachment site profile n=1 Tax=Desulfitobacterium hafniense TaxID=49338 RepID=A0A098B430_DESHA|nr:hypothetical protein [Desulfitobacterium hafniense]CDX02626.1 Prokaryotic membrane lipoprotein lipid attachment site profile [Desulfitobacterium hafniense]
MRLKLALLLLSSLLCLLSGCASTGAPPSASSVQENSSGETESENEAASNRADDFLANFSQEFSDFELLDYVKGSSKNAPIMLVGVAKNLKDNTSSTLFIVDNNGIGLVGLAAGLEATYRSEDGLKLSDNVVLLSLNVWTQAESSVEGGFLENKVRKIHDFEITVTQNEEQGGVNTVYANKETIRSD